MQMHLQAHLAHVRATSDLLIHILLSLIAILPVFYSNIQSQNWITVQLRIPKLVFHTKRKAAPYPHIRLLTMLIRRQPVLRTYKYLRFLQFFMK